jgi:hypothetical protein
LIDENKWKEALKEAWQALYFVNLIEFCILAPEKEKGEKFEEFLETQRARVRSTRLAIERIKDSIEHKDSAEFHSALIVAAKAIATAVRE